MSKDQEIVAALLEYDSAIFAEKVAWRLVSMYSMPVVNGFAEAAGRAKANAIAKLALIAKDFEIPARE